MYIEKVVNARKYILKSKYIGAGFTAKCFLLKDGRLLKLYHKDSYNKYMMFRRHNNMIDFLCELSKINNDTFIGPNGILINEQEENKATEKALIEEKLNKLNTFIRIKNM